MKRSIYFFADNNWLYLVDYQRELICKGRLFDKEHLYPSSIAFGVDFSSNITKIEKLNRVAKNSYNTTYLRFWYENKRPIPDWQYDGDTYSLCSTPYDWDKAKHDDIVVYWSRFAVSNQLWKVHKIAGSSEHCLVPINGILRKQIQLHPDQFHRFLCGDSIVRSDSIAFEFVRKVKIV